MRRTRVAGLVVALIAGFIGITAAPAYAKAITVAPGGSIQDAVDNAKPGDTIVLAPGEPYEGGVMITKDGITIRGNGATIEGPSSEEAQCRNVGDDDGFCVLSPTFDPSNPVKNVQISNLTVENFEGIGIVGFAAKGLNVHDVIATNNEYYGITAFSSTGTRFVHNQTSGGEEAGIYVGDSMQSDTEVKNNTTWDNQFGIFLRDSGHGHITGNNVHDNCVGIIAVDTDGNADSGWWDIQHNTVDHNDRACDSSEEGPGLSGIGIALLDSQHNHVAHNTVTNNAPAPESESPASGGIGVANFGGVSDFNSVHDNTLFGNVPVDLFWDGVGTHNHFNHNSCTSSSPPGLC